MKIKEFTKNVAAPIVTTILLLEFFRLICSQNGECNYLMLWFLTGIPVGLCHLFLLAIPRGYDTGGTMAILFLNLMMAGLPGGIILTWRLIVAAVSLVEIMATGIIRGLRSGCREW